MRVLAATIFGLLGYAKVPLAAVQLIEKVIYDLSQPNPPLAEIRAALVTLKDLLRSARKLTA